MNTNIDIDIDIDKLLATIAPDIDAAEIRKTDEDLWLIVFDEDFAIGVERDAAREVLVMETDLGMPAPGQELDAYKLLMQVTAAWRDTGGLRMGLDALDDAVVQIQELPLAALTPDNACAALRRFVGAARGGRAFIASLTSDDAAPTGMLAHLQRA